MKSFYSILYATINPTIQEQISIGLILTGEEKVFFNFSSKKLSYIRNFIPKSAYQLLKDSLKNIQNTVEQANIKKEIGPLGMNVEGLKERIFTQQYIDYLSRYNQNLLSFSTPKQIDIEANETYFSRLFEKYIYILYKETKPKEEHLNDIVRKDLYPKIEQRVNLDKELSSNEIDTLWMPVNVNFIGQNGEAVIGKTIEFKKQSYAVESELGHLAALMKAFDEKSLHTKYYVIGNEPDKKLKKQHILWNDIYETSYMDVVPSNEVEKIAEYIEDKNVQPFIKL